MDNQNQNQDNNPRQANPKNQLTCSGCKSYCPLTQTSCQMGERQALALGIIKPEEAVHTKKAVGKTAQQLKDEQDFWQLDFVKDNNVSPVPAPVVTDVVKKPKKYW